MTANAGLFIVIAFLKNRISNNINEMENFDSDNMAFLLFSFFYYMIIKLILFFFYFSRSSARNVFNLQLKGRNIFVAFLSELVLHTFGLVADSILIKKPKKF